LWRSELEIVARLGHLIGYFKRELTGYLQVPHDDRLDVHLGEGWRRGRQDERECYPPDEPTGKMAVLGTHKSSIPRKLKSPGPDTKCGRASVVSLQRREYSVYSGTFSGRS